MGPPWAIAWGARALIESAGVLFSRSIGRCFAAFGIAALVALCCSNIANTDPQTAPAPAVTDSPPPLLEPRLQSCDCSLRPEKINFRASAETGTAREWT